MPLCSCCLADRNAADFVKREVPDKTVCKPCRAKQHRAKYNAAHAGESYAANRSERLAYQAAWKKDNADKVAAYRKTSYARNRQAWLISARQREHAQAQRTPAWDAELTAFICAEAVDLRLRRDEATGVQWEIDHVIPLRGKRVSGLHVWNNLRVIPKAQNRQKHNAFDIF